MENPRKKDANDRYVKSFSKAIEISKLGFDCFVDGSPMTPYANIFLESQEYIPDLIKIVKKVDKFKIDKIILLTINKEKLKEFISKRGRKEEPVDETVERSLRLQEELIKLSKKQENVIIIERSNLDFTKEKDLKIVLDKIKN